MIHVVTVFFPPPKNKVWKKTRTWAMYYLLHRGHLRLKSFGHHAPVPVPREWEKVTTTQKNYSITSITLWHTETHERQAKDHAPRKDQ